MNGAVPLVDGRDPATGCNPLVLHHNGPAKPTVESPVPPDGFPVLNGTSYNVSAPDILTFRLLEPSVASRLASHLDAKDGWQPLPGDDVPGDELRLKAAGLADFAQKLVDAVKTRFKKQWTPPAGDIKLRDAFAIRYSKDGQASLRLHNDISHISATLVLRKADRGGLLTFPRQHYDDSRLEPGEVVMWPAPVTHPHAVTDVLEGGRMSIVLWTDRA